MALTADQERVLAKQADEILKQEQIQAIREKYQKEISAKQVEIGDLEKARDAEIDIIKKEVSSI